MKILPKFLPDRIEWLKVRFPVGSERSLRIVYVLAAAAELVYMACFGMVPVALAALIRPWTSSLFSLPLVGLSLVMLLVWVYDVCRTLFAGEPVDHYGITLRREDAPELFELTDEVGKAFGGRRRNEMLICEGSHAAAVQRNVDGKYRRITGRMLFGIHTLVFMPEDQFRSVVAHEMSHLYRDSLWINYLQIVTSSSRDVFYMRWRCGLNTAYAKPLEWIYNWILAISSVVANRNELNADQAAQSVSGGEVAAKALVRGYILMATVRDHSPLRREAFWLSMDEPPRDLVQREQKAAFAMLAQGDVVEQAALENINAVSSCEVVHPTLACRLSAIGVADPIPELIPSFRNVDRPAIELLGQNKQTIIDRVNARHFDLLSDHWTSFREKMEKKKGLLLSDDEIVSGESLWAHAYVAYYYSGWESARPWFKRISDSEPDDAWVKVLEAELGTPPYVQLLSDAQVEQLHELINLPMLYVRRRALNLLVNHYSKLGRIDELRDVERQEQQLNWSEYLLRCELMPKLFGAYVNIDRDELPVVSIGKAVGEVHGVTKLYVARQVLRNCQDTRSYIFVLQRKTWFGHPIRNPKLISAVSDALALCFARPSTRTQVVDSSTYIGSKIKRMGTCVYEAKK